jgi:3'-5' exoribonuclease
MSELDSEPTGIAVKNLQPGDAVLQFFELRSVDVRKTRAGEEYLDLTVADATGKVRAKLWPQVLRKWGRDFNPGDLVKIEGRIETYRDVNQLIIDKIRAADSSEIPDLEALIPATRHDPEGLFKQLIDLARNLALPEMSELVTEVLLRNEERLKLYPAARMVHHAYKGGLVEHTVTVVRKVDAIATLDDAVNRDLAIAGAMLHDIGKLRELEPSRHGRTLEGRLIGHLILGVEMVREVVLEKGLGDRKWLIDLEHILLSHHGETTYGSPVRPMTREAMVVHFIDNLDSRLKIVEEALETEESEGFSAYNKWLQGRAFAGSLSTEEEDPHA